MPFEFTNGGDVFYGQLSIDLDIRAIGEGRREVEVPSSYAMATLRRDSPTAPQTMLAVSGWVRVLGMMVSPGGRSSAIRANFELEFSIPGPENAPELVYRFSEAWFVSSPSPEDLYGGQGGYYGDPGGGETNVNVGVGINVVSDSGCGGDAPDPEAPAPADACAGDSTGDGVSAARSCAGDSADDPGRGLRLRRKRAPDGQGTQAREGAPAQPDGLPLPPILRDLGVSAVCQGSGQVPQGHGQPDPMKVTSGPSRSRR